MYYLYYKAATRFGIVAIFRELTTRLKKHTVINSLLIKYLSYSLFWVIPRRLNFICRRFGPICCSIFKVGLLLTPPTKMEDFPKRQHKIRKPVNRPKERVQLSEHGEKFEINKYLLLYVLIAYCKVFIPYVVMISWCKLPEDSNAETCRS
jgi:hypothetical protein